MSETTQHKDGLFSTEVIIKDKYTKVFSSIYSAGLRYHSQTSDREDQLSPETLITLTEIASLEATDQVDIAWLMYA